MLVGRVLADVGHACRAVAVSLLAVGVLATPLTAHAESGPGSEGQQAIVPAKLLTQAQANPAHVFAVIVQGRAESSDDVAFDIAEERASSSGGGKGTKKRFATISGVSAELTGEQILKLAERNDILAITPDSPVVMSGGMLPPSTLAPPTIDGVAQDGQTLTATDGVWSGTEPIEYVRRWQRCDALGSVCVDIEGSTGAAYTAGPADVGSTLRVSMTGTNPVGSETAFSDPTAVVAAAPVGPLPPVNLSPPAISGTATEGQTLSASEGTWGASFPVAYSYAWQRCDATGAGCVGAADATGASYVLTAADVGSTLRVVVTATDSGGSTSSTSPQSAVVAAAPRPPAASAPPAVSGDARDGATLTAAPGVWVASGAFSQDYSWERCGAGYDQAVRTDAPTGYWRLDGTAADASGHGLNGAASGTVSQVDGATSNSTAIAFGANGGIDVPNATIGAAFTLEAWVRVDRAQQDKGLLGRWRYADGGGALLWIDTQGHYGLAVGRQPSTYLTTTVAPQPGRWEHVVGTWDGTVLRVFVNGVEAGSQPFAGDIGSTLRDFEIGKYGDPPQHLEGAVDEAALYSRALGAADVSRHYAAGCHAIAGATGGSYTIGTADLGSQLRVRVTATNEAGSGTAVSNATATVQGAAPVSTSAPVVSGSALETQTLTASPGTWTGTAPIAYSYRWQRCDAAGATCVEILNAVGAMYMLSAADVGATVRVVVSATNGSGSAEAASAVSALVLAAAPAVTAAPSVSGTVVAGSTLTASPGTWNGVQPIAFSYRWQRCDTGGLCVDIADATGGTYTLTAADVGATVKVVVSATNASGSSEAVSEPTAAITGVAPASVSAPELSGSAMETQTLTATAGTWNGTQPIEHTYRWQRCDTAGACADIAGATGATYTLTAADVGATVKVVVSATNVSGSSEAASALSAQVLAAAPVSVSAPLVSGTPVDLQTLTASEGTWTGVQPITFSYRWQRCGVGGACAEILGAVGATYMLSAADVGSRLKVVVTATNSSGSKEAASDPTSPVLGAAPVLGTAPSLSGTSVETQTLTASEGMWSGTQPIAHSFAWQRCDAAGACVEIPGASGRTYTLTAADVGSRVKVVVTATNVAGSTQTASETTAVVTAAAPVSISAPVVSGAAIDQQTLTASPSTWSGIEPISFSYRWQRCDVGGGSCTEIVGALGATYVLSAADVGSRLRVVVSASNAAGSSEASSDKTGPVGGVSPGSVSAPELSGPAMETQTLTATEGTWSGTQPIAHSYRWQRCDPAGTCADIAGANGSTYALTAADVGAKVKVVVSATNMAGSSEAASAATGQVSAAAPASLSAPTVTGAALETQTLSASTGTWSGLEPITFAYRWQRCDTVGACADIAGAMDSTYTLTAADVGATVKAFVTATNAAGSSEAVSGATAAVISAAPVATVPPSVSGVAEDGNTLVASTGTWSGVEATLSVRWERCDSSGASCVAITGAEGTSYVLAEGDVGATVRAVVTATNAAGSVSLTTAASAVVLDSFTALQQWPSVVDALPSWASARNNVAAPAIAIVDSGIDASRSDFGGRVVHQETLTSLTPNSPGDGRGHGTFVASIAAGEAKGYAGVAPSANLVSIDVLDDSGRATTSDVIAAADWIYRNKAAYNIRVANFSLHATSPTSFRFDPLNKAIQKLWFSGVVVVASAGNYATDGAASGVPFPPGNDPFAITVGATDTLGTLATGDDKVAPWSAWGHTADGFVKPEISAPGRYMVGAVPPGSTLVLEQPERVIAPGYMQLSGTSFAAPIVAGAAAYVAGVHPEWGPDLIKGALMRSASNLPTVAPTSGGIGELAAGAAAALVNPPNPNAALNRFRVANPDTTAGPELIFDEAGWAAAVALDPAWADGVWGDGVWGDGVWGDGVWGDGVWGDAYWDPPATPPDPGTPGGTATSALNNASADWLPSGGYWLTPR